MLSSIASRIGYRDSLLIGTLKKTEKLQRVLNAAARIVANSRKYDQGLRHSLGRTGIGRSPTSVQRYETHYRTI